MGLFLVRRLVAGAFVVVLTAVFAYGGWRLLRSPLPENHPLLGKTLEDLRRVFLQGDLGTACSYLSGARSACPSANDLFARGWQADLWMLAGAIGLGTAAGLAAGLWSAVHPRTWRARALEALAMAGLVAPPFVLGLGLLLLFHPDFGRFGLPLFFDVNVYREPHEDPWAFLRAMLVPWLVAGAPVFAIVLRITRSVVVDARDEDFIRTAVAKGLAPAAAIRRHGRPLAYPAVFSWLGTAPALIVLNVLITETVFSVPGFLSHTRSAFKPPGDPERPDHELLQAEALWVAVLVVVLSILADLVVMARDPRVRTGRAG